jgi:hypothetical protein
VVCSGVRIVKKRELQRLHDCFDVVFLDFYAVLIDPPRGFVDFMRCLGFNDVECLVDGFKGVYCRGSYVYVPNVEYVGRHNPYRKYLNVVRSAGRLADRLVRLRDRGVDYMINVDLTVPKDVSFRWGSGGDGVKLLRKAFKLFVKRLESVKKGMLGYFFNIHLWSSETLEPHFHIHSSFLNAVYRDGRLIRFKPYLNVQEIRRIWKDCLKEIGLKIDGEVDVKVKYCRLSNRAAVVHRIKYCSRHPLIDVAAYYCRHGFEGFDEDQREWFYDLVYYVNRRICGGFLRKLSSMVGDVGNARCCPICGRSVGRVSRICGSETIMRDFESGSLIVVYWSVKDNRYYMICSSKCDLDGLLRWFDYHNDGG